MSDSINTAHRIHATHDDIVGISMTKDDRAELDKNVRTAMTSTNAQHGLEDQRCVYKFFTVPTTDPPLPCLSLLREAARNNTATLVCAHPTYEQYSLGVPSPPPGFRALDPQWWSGLSRAETHAGPLRSSDQVQRAKVEIKRQIARRRASETTKNGWLRAHKKNAEEGLRRQLLGLPMDGLLSRKLVDAATEANGWRLETEDVVGGTDDNNEYGQEVSEEESSMKVKSPPEHTRMESSDSEYLD